MSTYRSLGALQFQAAGGAKLFELFLRACIQPAQDPEKPARPSQAVGALAAR
jgi:hypothetical protein